MILAPFGGPKSLPVGSKIAPERIQNRCEKRFGFQKPCAHFKLSIGSRFRRGLGSHFGVKIGFRSDLKSLLKTKFNLIPFRSRFLCHFERFLTPHRRSKGRSQQQGNDYCRPFKITDFQCKSLISLLREMSYSAKNNRVTLS